jgi:hypothetical protein
VSLDGLPAAHLQVLLDGLPVFERYGLLLAGGYAFRAHEILHRPSQDLDFATRDNTPLPEIAEHVRQAFETAGYGARIVEAATGRYARLVLRLPGSGSEGVSVFSDEDFAEYGLDELTITDLRRWVTRWYDDLARRLAAERTEDELPDDL